MRHGKDKNDALLEVIELLYESVTEPERMVDALDRTYELFDSMAAHFFRWNHQQQRPDMSIGSRTYLGQQEVIDYYLSIDPRRTLLERQPFGYTLLCHEHIDESFVRNNEFFQDYSLRFGRRYLITTGLAQDGPSTTIIAMMRSPAQGPFSPHHAALLETLRPHLVRVTHLRRRFEQLRLDAALGQDLLDTMHVCFFVVDAEARILHMSQADDAMLRQGDPLRSVSGRLAAAGHAQTASLVRLIKQATGQQGVARGGSMIVDGSPMMHHGTHHGTHHPTRPGLTVMPLSRRMTRFDTPEIPLALVTISSPEKHARPNRQLREMFGLTAAEAELAAAVAAGKRLDDIAEERGVRITTVRTQMRSIYSKTGTNRQAELVQMIARLPVSWHPDM
jgi:DNA-binding CsgD family transcriptional regulator